MSAVADLSDEESFAELVRDLQRPIGSFLAQMTSDRSLAADLMQETFLVAWRERAQAPQDPAERRAWLYGVARNRALSALRRQRRGLRAVSQLIARSPPAPRQRPADEAIAMRDLLVRTLPPAERSLFVLRYVHDFDGPELAVLSGIGQDALRKRLQRASKRLADAYEQIERTPDQEIPNVQADAPI